jgi:non-ribosomal peptide synthetase component F
VQLRHRNFISYVSSGVIRSSDITVHHTSVSFDVHLTETAAALMMGGQIAILKPYGHLDIDYFTQTIAKQQVTYMTTVPTMLISFGNFLKTMSGETRLKTMWTITTIGMSTTIHSVSSI